MSEKYQNPDKACVYPCSPSDYCWSYANHVDGDEQFKNMTDICNGCEFWKPKEKR